MSNRDASCGGLQRLDTDAMKDCMKHSSMKQPRWQLPGGQSMKPGMLDWYENGFEHEEEAPAKGCSCIQCTAVLQQVQPSSTKKS